jgi:hypothetical protein
MSWISTILLLSTISAFSQVNRLQLNEKVGIGSYMHPGVARALHINAFPETVVNSFIIDATIRLSFGDCPVTDCATGSRELSYGHLTLLSPYLNPPTLSREYSAQASTSTFLFQPPIGEIPIGDMVLSASQRARHVIVTTRNPTGHIQLSTTPNLGADDIARMIIKPNGDIFLGKQSCILSQGELFTNPDNSCDVVIGSRLGIGNPGGSTCSTGVAGSITLFGYSDQSFNTIYNANGELRMGSGSSIGSRDLFTIGPYTGRVGIGFNLNTDERFPGNEKYANFLVSQRAHTPYPDGFGMDNIVMRVERRMPSIPPVDPYTLISAGDGANTESFAVKWDGTVQSAVLAGVGTRQVYADANGNLTVNATGVPSPWTLSGNSGTTSAHFIGTTDDKPLVLKTNNTQRVNISDNGDIQIGATNFSRSTLALPDGIDCRLAVDGQIVAKNVLVKTSGWADFVFNDNYQLMPLNELEQFLKENKHLPDVPTESEVLTHGIDIGLLQTTMLQKIEELTLYMILLEKKNKELQQRIDLLEGKK